MTRCILIPCVRTQDVSQYNVLVSYCQAICDYLFQLAKDCAVSQLHLHVGKLPDEWNIKYLFGTSCGSTEDLPPLESS